MAPPGLRESHATAMPDAMSSTPGRSRTVARTTSRPSRLMHESEQQGESVAHATTSDRSPPAMSANAGDAGIVAAPRRAVEMAPSAATG